MSLGSWRHTLRPHNLVSGIRRWSDVAIGEIPHWEPQISPKSFAVDPVRWVDTSVTSSQGKVFLSSPRVLAVEDSLKCPDIDCFGLQNGDSAVVPKSKNAVTLFCVSFRHYGFSIIRSWMDIFDQELEPTFKNKVSTAELCFIDAGFFSFARNAMAKSLKSKIEVHRLPRSYVKFDGVMETATALQIPNVFTGYVFVVDRRNRIRWAASGEPSEEESKVLKSVVAQLVKEAT